MSDRRQFAPAAARNRGPILEVLREALPATGLVLELASGTGEHAVHFARALPQLRWQPSDPDPLARASIAAWVAGERLGNVLPPLALDVLAQPWPLDRADAIVCINLAHISPWEATVALFAGARTILAPDAPLYLYGPFRRSDRSIEPSNAAFDASLRARDPRWGLRELDAVTACAAAQGFALELVRAMPANNLSVVYRRTGPVHHRREVDSAGGPG